MHDEHCHILWGVDDGSKTREETQAMLGAAKQAGVTSIVCTPHMRWDDFDQNLVKQHFAEFRELAASQSVVARLGYEVFYNRLMLKGVDSAPSFAVDGDIKVVGMAAASVSGAAGIEGSNSGSLGSTGAARAGSSDAGSHGSTGIALSAGAAFGSSIAPAGNARKSILIEFNAGHSMEQGWEATLHTLQAKYGFEVTMAHPERYTNVLDDYELLYSIRNMGVRMQISACDLLGGFFNKTTKCAKWMLKEGLCNALVSDAHCVKDYQNFARVVNKYGHLVNAG